MALPTPDLGRDPALADPNVTSHLIPAGAGAWQIDRKLGNFVMSIGREILLFQGVLQPRINDQKLPETAHHRMSVEPRPMTKAPNNYHSGITERPITHHLPSLWAQGLHLC